VSRCSLGSVGWATKSLTVSDWPPRITTPRERNEVHGLPARVYRLHMTALADGESLLYEVGTLVARARRLVWTAAAHELEAHGLPMPTWVLLATLVRSGPSTQRELADATGQHAAGVSRLVNDLEAQKLVRRSRDDVDRRRARVEITAAGKAFCRVAKPHVIGALREALAPMSTTEQRALRALLLKLVPPPEPVTSRKNASKRA
jgi:DNA-binding MarR family transcriptional regulator